MNKKRKILIPALALCSSALMAFGVVGANFTPTKVDAEATPYNLLKIEDAITSISDVHWRKNGQAYFNATPSEVGEYYVASNNSVYAEDTYRLYTSTEEDAGTDGDEYSYSKNDYAGNLSLYSADYNSSSKYASAYGLEVEGKTNNDLLSFTTTYAQTVSGNGGRSLWLFARRHQQGQINTSTRAGYRIVFSHSNSTTADLIEIAKGSSANTSGNSWAAVSLGTTSWEQEIADYAAANPDDTAPTKVADLAASGDIFTFTFGAYTTEEGKTFVTIRIDNATKGLKNIVELTVEDNDTTGLDTTAYNNFGIITKNNTANYLNPDVSKSFMIGGVDRPILAETKETTVTGDYKEGASVASVELPAGYTLKSTEGTLVAGENVLAATYVDENDLYYGKPCVYEAKVTVNATAVKKVTMTVQDEAGNELSSAQVNEGEIFTLTATAQEGTLIGFKEGDNFYPVGKEITAAQDTVFTAVCVDFDTLDGAAVRMKNDEVGFAGIRFTAALAKADATKLGTLFNLKAIVVPTDLIVDEFDYNEAGAVAFNLTAENFVEGEDENYYELAFGYTNLKYGNYNRAFSALTFIEVAYTDGSEAARFCAAYDEENNSRSIYEVAYKLYELKKDEYSAQNLAYLESYVANTVDVTAACEVNVVLDIEKNYTVSLNDTVMTIVYKTMPVGCTAETTTIFVPVNVWDNGVIVAKGTQEMTFDAATLTATSIVAA